MSFSVIPLLVRDPSLPAKARRALEQAASSGNRLMEDVFKRRAAGILMRRFDLSWDEVTELLAMPRDEPRANMMPAAA